MSTHRALSWTCVLALAACAEAAPPDDSNDFIGGGGAAGFTTPPPAAVPPAVTPTSGTSGAATAGTTAPPTAGSGGAGGTLAPSGGSGGTPAPIAGSVAEPPPEPTGPLMPIIPPLMGECPTFTTGTKTINGLGGISFQVGAKVEGAPTGPLVFYWHGTGSSSFEGAQFPGIQDTLAAGGVFVAFARSTGTGGDCSGTGTFSQDDFKIADQIVACAVKDHNIDARQIYATGCSAGGLFAGCMGIERSSYLAATVPNSGGITIGYGAIQDPMRMPAVMTMHGGGADMVIVAFGPTSKAYDSLMVKHGSPLVINCDHGGGHCGAPGSLYADGWKFMKAHPFGMRPSPWKDALPADFSSSCEIWTATDMLPYGGDPTEVKTPVTGTPYVLPTP